MAGDNIIRGMSYGILDYNPIEKTTTSIVYCYVNTKNGKISHSLGDLYNDDVITKIVKSVMKIHRDYINVMLGNGWTVPAIEHIFKGMKTI